MHLTAQQCIDTMDPIELREANKIMMAFEHMVRCNALPNYNKLFRQRFSERAKLNETGVVNITDLVRDVLAEMGVDDPVKGFE